VISRRRFILSSSGLILATPSFANAAFDVQRDPFTLGVASGSPSSDGCVIWTRLAPDPLNGGGMPDAPVALRYRVCRDAAMRDTVRDGQVTTDASVGHSVHVTLRGLEAGRDYWYQFYLGEDESGVGRTRTSDPGGDELRLAVASCQSYESGHYAAFADIARWQPDCVIHLGDYIYEGGAHPLGSRSVTTATGEFAYATVRQNNSAEITTLWDYRNRYALYRLDEQLQAAHAASPWIVAMDDHEVDNNWAGFTPQDPWAQTDTEFRVRRQAAFRAYYEHMPLRRAPEILRLSSSLRMYEAYRMGPAQIHLLDTRQFRSDQVPADADARTRAVMLADRNRGMLGDAQERWLMERLEQRTAVFNVLAQQTWFTPFNYSDDALQPDVNMDQWDGYPLQRQRLVEAMAQRNNNIVLSGDWHCANAAALHLQPEDARSPQLGWEFATTSISSHCPWAERVHAATPLNAHVRYTNGSQRGYLRCSVSRQEWLSEFMTVDDPYRPDSSLRCDHAVTVSSG